MAKEPKQLDELFHDTLKDIYYAEKKILSALPKMAKAAQNEDLTAAFEKHQAETEGQISRLEQVFDLIDQKCMFPHFRLTLPVKGPGHVAPIKRASEG